MLAPGHSIAGRYRLIRLLGRGGMGEVWHARNEAVERDFAVKILLGTAEGDAPAKRLLREGRAAGRLRHPNIMELFDAAVDPDLGPYLVMELLDGNSLAEGMRRCRTLPLVTVVGLGATIAGALRVAHDAGVIHRDLKAANVFLHRTRDGVVPKLVDFGISKLHECSEEQVTSEGTVVGSPLGMSPEQAMGRSDVDHRTDVWSLGVLLYRMLTGSHPFRGATPGALLRAIVMDEPVPWRELVDAPPELHALIEGCLRKNPRERPSTAHELQQALVAIAERCGLAPMKLEPLMADDDERTDERSLEVSVGEVTPAMGTAETPAMLPLPQAEPAKTIVAPRRRGYATPLVVAGVCALAVVAAIAARSRSTDRAEPAERATAAREQRPAESMTPFAVPSVTAAEGPPAAPSPSASLTSSATMHKPKPAAPPKKPALAPKPKPHDPVKHADF